MECVNGAIVNKLLVLDKKECHSYILYYKLQLNASDRLRREGDKRMGGGASEVKGSNE